MARAITLIVPGRLTTRTGGSIYDCRLKEALEAEGWSVAVRELAGDFPTPDVAAIEGAARVLAALPDRHVVVIDGLAGSALPDALERESVRLRIVVIVHLPVAADVGLDPATAMNLRRLERRAFHAAARVVVTGTATRDLLAGYELAAERVVTVEPGTDAAPLARGGQDHLVHLFAVGTVNHGKGYDLLLQGLARVPRRNWRLTCAGSTTRYPAAAAQILALSRALGLEQDVVFAGELDADAVARGYDRADVFVLATRQETFGMAVAEALARGLPVVSTTTGAVPSLVGSDAGVLVPPGDVEALSEALTRVTGDAELRRRLAEGAGRVRARLPSWRDAGGKFSGILEGLTS
jgi:glycosyltransferase involved in cell wall biosynthesis